MRVATKTNLEKTYIVYGVYWPTFNDNLKAHYYVIESDDEFPGFSVFIEDEVVIKDPSLDHYLMVKDGYGKDMIVHKAAYSSEDLFDALINHDSYDNVLKLYENMRALSIKP